MNLQKLTILFLTLSFAFTAISQSVRIEKSIPNNWTFNYFPEETAKLKYPGFNDKRWDNLNDPIWNTFIERPEFDDSKWSIVAIPHTWSTYETTGEVHPYIKNVSNKDNPFWWNGIGWYRKRFTIDKSLEGKKVFVEFEGVQKNCRVYINGKPVGEHFGGYTGFSMDLSDFIRVGEENVIAVSVSNKQDDNFKVAPKTAGNWNLYGGIYRNVKLIVTDKLFIPYAGSAKYEGGTFITTPNVSNDKAKIDIKTWVRNEYSEPKEFTLITKIIDKKGEKVCELKSIKQILPFETKMCFQETELANPDLWDTDNPNLYLAVSEISFDNQILDSYKTKFGIREFTWDYDSNFLYVNGKKTNLQGFNHHQEYPWLGDAVPNFIHEMDIRDMKENLNCNFLRPGQYISAPYVFDTCDSLGLITCGEFPNVKDLDFSIEMQEIHARELIRQYRNHPSILLWDVGDETNRAADSRWVYEEDDTRFITCRDCPGPSSGKFINFPSKHLRLSKMLNCNVRGWYDDDEMNIRPENQQHATNEQHRHETARKSQYGTSNNRIDQPNLVVWLYEDHGCDRRYQNAPLLFYNPKGWVDAYRVPKFSYYLWQANYTIEPMIFIHPQFWRSQYIGQKKDIEIDSNCESIELKVNNRSLGVKKPSVENYHVVKFEQIPVEQGTLTAIGTKGGELIIKELKMSSEQAKLTIKSSHNQINASESSIVLVTADIVDADNNHIYGAHNTIKWEVMGPATLAGPTVYQSDFSKRMETAGTLYIDMPVGNVVRSTGEPGIITVRVFAAGLKMGETKIEAIKTPIDTNSKISEFTLNQIGREKVVQNPEEIVEDNVAVLPIVSKFTSDITTNKNQNKSNLLTQVLKKNSHDLDTESAEFIELLNILTKTLSNGDGLLSAQELNYNIYNFNRFSTLKKIIDETMLPEKIKTDLKDYFVKDIITLGNGINIEQVKSVLSSLPLNTTVAVPGTKKKILGVISTESMDISYIVNSVNEKFSLLKYEEKEDYLKYLSELNPWLEREYYMTGDAKLGTRQEHITYLLTAERAIIIPEVQFIKRK